jgi:hypothetical protein
MKRQHQKAPKAQSTKTLASYCRKKRSAWLAQWMGAPTPARTASIKLTPSKLVALKPQQNRATCTLPLNQHVI